MIPASYYFGEPEDAVVVVTASCHEYKSALEKVMKELAKEWETVHHSNAMPVMDGGVLKYTFTVHASNLK